MPLRGELGDPLGGDRVADDLAIDVRLADSAGDELRVLRPEIEDQNLLVRRATRACRFRLRGAHRSANDPSDARPRAGGRRRSPRQAVE